MWVLFELLEYHLLTFVAHLLIVVLLVVQCFKFINKSPPKIPDIQIPEKPFLQIVSTITFEINQDFVVIRDIASGKDLQQFLSGILVYLKKKMKRKKNELTKKKRVN
ncbi:hypothetical protein RchiOBHm_Chr2g0115581 [Rosa chinensis]|uniref:Reticulon-like protein n=1 Tax=Rosa chinensis TaxID=74649 RepID=A0A2P6RR15_ROSCH|nr:hypothetical protein RchiOBHm_Chr2g0115581 [Rosa chinensis]